MNARQAIKITTAEFVDAINRGDAAALTTGYAEDCAVFPINTMVY